MNAAQIISERTQELNHHEKKQEVKHWIAEQFPEGWTSELSIHFSVSICECQILVQRDWKESDGEWYFGDGNDSKRFSLTDRDGVLEFLKDTVNHCSHTE